MKASNSDDESDLKEESESSEDEVGHMFEAENAWRLEMVWAVVCLHENPRPVCVA